MSDFAPAVAKKRYYIMTGTLLLAALVCVSQKQDTAPLRLVQTIPLPGVEGRNDHFALDLQGQRLFLSALGSDSVEVIDLKSGKVVHTISNQSEPQGIGYANAANKIFVANGNDGSVRILDADSYRPLGTVSYSDDADNVRYDPAHNLIYVGYGSGAIGILDASSGKRIGDVKLDAHPESFQLEKIGPRLFVNVPHAGHIAVIDRDQLKVIAKWPLGDAQANFPMALDESTHRLFVVCRKPAELIVFDTESGKQVMTVPVVGDADDVFYDAARHQIYVSGGEGFISVIGQSNADKYSRVAEISTVSGARTSYFAPELNRLYLAVPHRGDQQAEIRVYEAHRP